MVALLLLLIAAAHACPQLPQRGSITAQRCAFWDRVVVAGNATFASTCFAVSLNDLTAHVDDTLAGRVDQKVVALGTVLRVRDCSGNTAAIMKERLSSFLNPLRGFASVYDLEDGNGNALAVVRRVNAIVSQRLEFSGRVNANVSVSTGELALGAVCAGSVWEVACSGVSCDSVTALAAWFSVARDSSPPCHSVFWFVVVGVPVIVCAGIAVVVAFIHSKTRHGDAAHVLRQLSHGKK